MDGFEILLYAEVDIICQSRYNYVVDFIKTFVFSTSMQWRGRIASQRQRFRVQLPRAKSPGEVAGDDE